MPMIRIFVALALSILTALPAAAKSWNNRTIVDVAANARVFGTLLAAAGAAGLADELKEVHDLTVFAPTDAAFAKLPAGTVERLLKPENRGELRAIIAYHILPARVNARHLPTVPKLVETLNGCERLRVVRSGHRVHVDGARVTHADVWASNGVIHVIDSVPLPARACF